MTIYVPMPIQYLLAGDYRCYLFAFSFLLPSSFLAQGESGGWELQVDKDGIRIFSRWIEHQQGQKVREIRATFTVAAAPAQLLSVLQDADKATDWMAGAKSFDILAAHGPKSWYAYTEFDLPWPFQNQDLVALYKVEQNNGQTVRVKVQAHPEYRPQVPKVERMQHFEACWTFQLLDNGKTDVTYRAHTYRKPSAPRWVSDPVVQNTLWKTMASFKAVAEE